MSDAMEAAFREFSPRHGIGIEITGTTPQLIIEGRPGRNVVIISYSFSTDRTGQIQLTPELAPQTSGNIRVKANEPVNRDSFWGIIALPTGSGLFINASSGNMSISGALVYTYVTDNNTRTFIPIDELPPL